MATAEGGRISYHRNAEDAAAVYLTQPGRGADLDRFLVDMLLASEVFAYACQRRDSRWVRWWGILLNAAIGYGIASWLHGEIWYVLATIWLIWTVVAHVWDGLKARRLLASMLSTYHVLNGRVVSLPHLRSQVNKSTAAGVVWPGTLHALLDDTKSGHSASNQCTPAKLRLQAARKAKSPGFMGAGLLLIAAADL